MEGAKEPDVGKEPSAVSREGRLKWNEPFAAVSKQGRNVKVERTFCSKQGRNVKVERTFCRKQGRIVKVERTYGL